MSLPWLIGLAAVLLFARPLLRVVIALVAGRAIGRSALAKQADRIHLVPSGPTRWQAPQEPQRLAQPLLSLGYQDAGTFTVRELPGVVLRLLAHTRDSVMAVIYEHPKAGHWVELVTRYTDRTSFSVATSRDTGLAPRPGHPVVHAPGTDPARLHARMTAARPQGIIEPVEPAALPARFEEGYAEAMAWRKAHGISTAEVVKVAARPAA